MVELAYTKSKTYRWLRRDQRTDEQHLVGESRLVEIRRARTAYLCTDCGRSIATGSPYGWRFQQRFRAIGRDGLYERLGWPERYCPRCLVAEPLVSFHARLPRNRRRISGYIGNPQLRQKRGVKR